MTIVPERFSGQVFADKYGLDSAGDDFFIIDGELLCAALPNLKESDLLDCVSVGPEPITEMIYDLEGLLARVEDLEEQLKKNI